MSRDIKSTDITGINDGLDRAINRLHYQMRSEMASSIQDAAKETARQIDALKEKFQREYSQADQEELRQRIEEIQEELGAQIDENARKGNQRMLEFEKSYSAALQEMSDSFYDSMAEQQELFAKQMQDFQYSLEGQQAQIETLCESLDAQQEQIDTLQQNVHALFELHKNKENEMKLAAGRALALLEAVRERTDVERFAQQTQRDRINQLESRLQGIESNPDSCTITDVNNLVDETIVMEKEALREQAKWRVKQNQAMTIVNALLRMMQESMELKVNSIYDETQQEELQADYWTHGKFHELEESINEVKQRIYSEEADVDELDRLIVKMQEMEKKLDCLRKEAVHLGLLCEERITVVNDIIKSMKGWELKEDVGFMGGRDDEDDEREGAFAILYNPTTKEELSIIVYNEEQGDDVVNKIVVQRNADGEGEVKQSLRVRMQQIKERIERSGHKLGDLNAPPRGGDGKLEQIQSGTSLKRKGAAKKLKNELRKQKN